MVTFFSCDIIAGDSLVYALYLVKALHFKSLYNAIGRNIHHIVQERVSVRMSNFIDE